MVSFLMCKIMVFEHERDVLLRKHRFMNVCCFTEPYQKSGKSPWTQNDQRMFEPLGHTEGSLKCPEKHGMMYFTGECICILSWNAPKSNILIFGPFGVLKSITCFFLGISHFSMFENLARSH